MGASHPRKLNCAGPTTCHRAAPTISAPLISDSTSTCQGDGAAGPVRGDRNSAARRPSRIQAQSESAGDVGGMAGVPVAAVVAPPEGADGLSPSGISILAGSGPHWLGWVSAQAFLAFRSVMAESCHRQRPCCPASPLAGRCQAWRFSSASHHGLPTSRCRSAKEATSPLDSCTSRASRSVVSAFCMPITAPCRAALAYSTRP